MSGERIMRVLYHHRIASKDGQYVHVSEIVDSLRALGVEMHIVSPAVTEAEQFGGEAGLIAGLKRRLPKAAYEALEVLYSAFDLLKMVIAIARIRPTVVYERYQLFFPSGVLAAKLFKVPLILEVNAPLFDERSRYGGLALKGLAKWTERFVWRNANAVLPVTRVLAEHIIREGVQPDRVEVIPNGVDPARFASGLHRLVLPTFPPGSVVVGFVGFCREWHRLDRIVKLVAEDYSKRLSLLIVGDGPAIPNLSRQVERLACADRVHFAGLVPRGELPKWLEAMDIAIQPAVVPYASPLKLIEYMASGKAIIAPSQDNIRELLSHERDALLFEQDNAHEFLTALLRLVEDKQLRARLGAAAQKTVQEKRLYWEQNARKIVSLAIKLTNLNESGVAAP